MVIAGMIYWALSSGQTDPAVQDKIGYLTIFLVLIVTAICRKFFYKRIWSEAEVIEVVENKNSYTQKVKEKAAKQGEKMKIYVDKEIK